MQVFKEKIHQYGFDSDYDILEKTNFTLNDIKKVFLRCQKDINENCDIGRKTLTVVYYGGHGMMRDN